MVVTLFDNMVGNTTGPSANESGRRVTMFDLTLLIPVAVVLLVFGGTLGLYWVVADFLLGGGVRPPTSEEIEALEEMDEREESENDIHFFFR